MVFLPVPGPTAETCLYMRCATISNVTFLHLSKRRLSGEELEALAGAKGRRLGLRF